MIIRKNVHSTRPDITERDLNVDTVYLRSNIHQIKDNHGRQVWEYDETQMSYEEYYKKVIPDLENEIKELRDIVIKIKEANS